MPCQSDLPGERRVKFDEWQALSVGPWEDRDTESGVREASQERRVARFDGDPRCGTDSLERGIKDAPDSGVLGHRHESVLSQFAQADRAVRWRPAIGMARGDERTSCQRVLFEAFVWFRAEAQQCRIQARFTYGGGEVCRGPFGEADVDPGILLVELRESSRQVERF